MPKHTSAADPTAVRVVIVTLDSHLATAAERARPMLMRELPGLTLTLHAASDWADDPAALDRCRADIAQGDIIIVTMLFMEEHIQAVLPALQARREHCDAMVGCLAAGEIVRLTRLGQFTMDGSQKGPLALLKRLRGKQDDQPDSSSGAKQMAMLRRIPKILRFIPGTAQDVRAYFLTLQYWLAGSDENVANMVRYLINRYADGPRSGLRNKFKVDAPLEYPEVGVYHPNIKDRITDQLKKLPKTAQGKGTVGVLVMRSYVLAGNTAHYDGMIAALEGRGLTVIPAFASGLDARPAIERFFIKDGKATVDCVLSLTGFSLVGGPAYNDAKAAEEILASLDVPYIAAHAVEFQTMVQWRSSDNGLLPVEATMMVAIPELDGSIGPTVYGGRCEAVNGVCQGCKQACQLPEGHDERDMHVCRERVDMLAARVEKLATLRATKPAERKIAITIFNFPPNAGNTGTAAYLGVFESLYRTLGALKQAGYQVDMPDSVDTLRERIVNGNAQTLGAHANVYTRISVDDHVRRERYLSEIEAQWGPAPGRQQSDGGSIFVLGERFGNVFIGVQPAFGYEGDPMRLLFEKGFAPTHAFSAFYRYLREDFGAHAVLHFGTHGALEFMPGKQAGMSGDCWPDRLIADLPNFYLYASNNPSEGTIAKRRSAATLITYMTPPVAHAGLYRGLLDLKSSIDHWRNLEPSATEDRARSISVIQAQAAELELTSAEPAWTLEESEAKIVSLSEAVLELEYTLIPHGLHVVGEAANEQERRELLSSIAEASTGSRLPEAAIAALVSGATAEKALKAAQFEGNEDNLALFNELVNTNRLLSQDHELPAIIRALDGRYIRPAPGGDVLRTPSVLPTGRNMHGFDPFRIPSTFAMADGLKQATILLDRYMQDGHPLPESIAMVLWGTDNLKSEGGPIAQALALIGAKPRFDGYGRLAGAALIPLEALGRPRIDVVMTLSGIFRDLLPLQTRLLAEAAFLAATADEPIEQNFVRKHALEYQAKHQCDLETAALRVFSNADGAYGSNVNFMIDNSCWNEEDELAETYTQRKSFAYGRKGRPVKQAQLLEAVMGKVELAYQNLDSVELGVTTVDHYFDTLGGISRTVQRAKGGDTVPVYIGDQTKGEGTVRTLSEQVALETRTRMLNPKWYEGMLKHGYEGVRQIESHVTNTMGWSATTGQVAPWVYQQLTQTYILDPVMRERMAALNPTASAKVVNRLIEAHERQYWTPDPAMLEALRQAGEELEDRLEGITPENTKSEAAA
ncbi:magnesium chelatase subunit H [Thiorhodospira sibirica]|uniref:magnesium chelatase subunit H n=1 Tax=Thiorhodospira sibirica TaxID=154347 RepID=UPI00022C39D9|nr:magnesium chelatase subunit H [Thiorhodospira sibirica]